MFRIANTLRNNNFLNSLRRSTQVKSKGELSKIIRRKCTNSSNELGLSAVVSSLPHQNETPVRYTWLDSPSNWTEPYLTDRSRSASVEGTVKAILSSSNPHNRIDKLPPLNHMACDDLISMLIAFDDAGLPTHCRIMRTLVEEITDQMKNDPQAASLHAMANFTVFANNNRHRMNKYLLCVDLFAPLTQRLASCDNLEDIYHITVCLSSLNRLVTQDSVRLYTTKLKELVASGKLSRDSDTIIISKILRFLNFAPWSFNNGPIFRSVLELLLPRIEQLTDQELVDMLSMYQVHFEPGAVVAPIVRLAEKRILEQSSATNNYNYHNVPLLYCCSMTEIPEKNNRIINCLDAYLDTMPTDIVNDSLLFQMLRRNKQSARNVYDKYWSKVATELAAMDPKRTPNFDNMLSKACYRYCYFDNSQRGQYRHLPFEEIATKLVIDEINTGISGMIPRKFVKLATFLLGFGSHQTTHRFPENFVQRVEDMVRQYTVHDILQLSRGVELFYTRGNCKRSKSMRSRMNDDSNNQMCRVENLLDVYTERYITSIGKKVPNLNKLLYVYSASKMPRRTAILNKLIKSIEEEASGDDLILSSRIIRDVMNNLSKLNYMVPEICNKIMRYLNENRSTICGNVIGRALFILYSLGYEPAANVLLPDDQGHTQEQQLIRFDDFGAIIERDFELMPGLTIVRACLALVFYRALSMELIEKVFNLNFLMRLESEISICYENAPYSSRSLDYIMQLNRAVCFGYPEARIPWFQQNYIEAHISSIVPKNPKFHEDISRMLLSFIGDKSLIETNHVTPYGYRIPFVLYFNSNKEVVRPPIQKNTHELTKFAIIPLEDRSYCYNTNIPRGEEQLQERHLGMLGFNVVHICYGDWNKMHMNIPGAKETFLKKILELNLNGQK